MQVRYFHFICPSLPRYPCIRVFLSQLTGAPGLIARQATPASPECTQARQAIVSALRTTGANVQQIQDPTTQQAAVAGVQQAGSGIRQIAQALAAGQPPPAEGRDVTETGLVATGNALAAGNP